MVPEDTDADHHLVFDLGGVLVDFRGVSSLATRLELSTAEMAQRWLASSAVRAFERGETTTDDFLTAIGLELKGLGHEFSRSELQGELNSWLPGPLPGALDFLRRLAQSKVAHSCLSNTNEMHWRLMQSWGVHETFEHCFLSHQLGMVKPDREIFEHVVTTLGLAPSSVVFFDDHPTNVAAACDAGLLGVQVSGPQDCESWLEEHLRENNPRRRTPTPGK